MRESRRRSAFLVPLISASLAALPAQADVVASAPDGFEIQCKGDIAMSSRAAYGRLVDIGSWWSPSHTYSQDAGNLRLSPRAGGSWRETWKGGDIEHGRVIAVTPGAMLRFDAALGPLQQMGVQATLTFSLEPNGAGRSAVTATYQVSGRSDLKLDAIAPVVEGVLCEQVARFVSGRDATYR